MRVAISGSHGFIGAPLTAALIRDGHEVRRLTRKPSESPDEIPWPDGADPDLPGLSACDAVIHLAGEGVSGGRWSSARKSAIRSSRVDRARRMADALARCRPGPRHWLCASAIGYYGSRGREPLTERSDPGTGFLSEVCRETEEAAREAVKAGVRVTCLRIGMVLHASGGALRRMLPAFRLGLGGPVGGGQQMVSWIALEDAVSAIRFILQRSQIDGPVNLTTPHPLPQREFAMALGQALNRKAILPIPALALRIAMGEAAYELALGGACALPLRLLQEGYVFRHPDLKTALEAAFNPRHDYA